ncbi:autophagy-related 18f [Olea europaea subsp. europaea]|uniref:Autophagy-related 18f n=1 Tax=Olea europaea subsp. europaea TaxID=158383 RepID=A0A8S0TSU2_OLEEU|nr:autophagy-related 18f [Olea europaea subsp. europaea]
MRNDDRKIGGGDGWPAVPRPGRGNNGILPTSFKSLSSYLRTVSSGASNVASTVRSAASASSVTAERDSEYIDCQVNWAGFDKLEDEGGITWRVLLLAYSYGFQVWDVEEAANVQNLVSRHDGPVSFMQMLPKPMASKQSGDKFVDSCPLLIICADGSFSGGNNNQERFGAPCNGSIQQYHGSLNGSCVPTVVWFYSLRSQSYIHLLRFRSVIHVVRCSSRVVAVLQSNQIHCFNASTLDKEYTILTNPFVKGTFGSGNIGFGPLAVGPRWMAYSGSQVANSDSGRVIPEHLTPSASFPNPTSNESLIAHYAKESSKQLAAGIVTLGDKGYKKLSSYYSELVPEGNNSQSGKARGKVIGVATGFLPDAEDAGMVIVRDTVTRTVVAQFRAHKSPIQSLCFDPSGNLLVTASVQGHNINVFCIMPGHSGASSGPSYCHIYRLQRGFTNAVIQDISFSVDSQWIMISSSRGTSHLFPISPSGGSVSTDACFSTKNSRSSLMAEPTICNAPNSGLQVLTQRSVCISGPPITVNAVSRIRNGNSGWRNTVKGAAAAATGRMSSLSGVIASAFFNCKANDSYADTSSPKKNYYLMVFSPSGNVVQYALRLSPVVDSITSLPGASTPCESGLNCDTRLAVEPIQKWNICQKQNRKEQEDNIYAQKVNSDSSKVFPTRTRHENNVVSNVMVTTTNDNITEERHQMYISGAELRMHESQNPLWLRSEVPYLPRKNRGWFLSKLHCLCRMTSFVFVTFMGRYIFSRC